MNFNNLNRNNNNIIFSDFYSDKINNLSLKECLEIHYHLNPQFTRWDKYDALETRNLIKSHDISHIIFGCDTSYSGEYCVQTWAKLGANLNIPMRERIKYITKKDLIQLILPPKLISYSLTHISEFSNFKQQIRTQAQLMTKKWEYFNEEKYMDKTIGEIRKEYNIVF